jgi:hypothetical protein
LSVVCGGEREKKRRYFLGGLMGRERYIRRYGTGIHPVSSPRPNKEHARPEPELQKDKENKQKKHHHDVSKECT